MRRMKVKGNSPGMNRGKREKKGKGAVPGGKNKKERDKSKKAGNPHDVFFKKHSRKITLYVCRKVLTSGQFALFDWRTFRSGGNSYVNRSGREKIADFLFSVKIKNSRQTAEIALLLEHRTYQDNKALQRLLEYMAAIYGVCQNPIIPIILHQGPEKEWREKLSFQDSLIGMTNEIRREFGGEILNFKPRFINFQEISALDSEDLTINPIIYIMTHIWGMDGDEEAVFAGFAALCNKIGNESVRNELLRSGWLYMKNFNKKLDKNWIEEMSNRHLGEDNMVYETFEEWMKDEFKKEGEKEGEKKGLKEGERKGLKEGEKKGLKEGEKKGLKEGEKKGLKEGQEKERKKIVMQMLGKGMDESAICEYTGLTKKQVETLKKAA